MQAVVGQSLYNAAKAGVINLCKSAAVEAARLGVRVNTVSPSPVASAA
jgi:NAD(P)-dependent dehydrogenase (short-subunit alcohol dehydrogenase family)